MKKRYLIPAAALALILVLAGGTIAFLTRTGDARSEVSASNVKVSLVMLERDDEGNTKEVPDSVTVSPGEEVRRVASIKNTGDQTAWVRLSTPVDMEGIEIGPDEFDDWEYQEGFWYYKNALEPGESTSGVAIFVYIDSGLGNEDSGSTVELDVRAEGTQKKNNGEQVLEAQGWPEE